MSSHKLKIETGRHHRPIKIPVDKRVCDLCKCNAVQDEKHVIMDCLFFSKQRQCLFEKIESKVNGFKTLSKNAKFIEICSLSNPSINLSAKFILTIMQSLSQ